jgi:hypothetical protein
MNDEVGVGVADRLGGLLEDGVPPLGARITPFFEKLGEGFSLDELHHQKRAAVGQGSDLVNRGNAVVLELAGDPGLLDEPPADRGFRGEAALQELHRDVAVDRQLAGALNHAHASFADERSQLVAQRGGQGGAIRRTVALPSGRDGGRFRSSRVGRLDHVSPLREGREVGRSFPCAVPSKVDGVPPGSAPPVQAFRRADRRSPGGAARATPVEVVPAGIILFL